MSSQRKQVCDCCKQPLIEHRQMLSTGLVRSLWVAYSMKRKDPFRVAELGLTHGDQANWQKLRYWGLVQKEYDAQGHRIGGHWSVTDIGEAFLAGLVKVDYAIWTYRGEVVEWEHGKKVGPRDCWEGYRGRRQWAQDARDRDPPQQTEIPGLTPAGKTV